MCSAETWKPGWRVRVKALIEGDLETQGRQHEATGIVRLNGLREDDRPASAVWVKQPADRRAYLMASTVQLIYVAKTAGKPASSRLYCFCWSDVSTCGERRLSTRV